MLFSCLLQVFCKITIKNKESKTSIAFFVILFLSMVIFPSRTFHAVMRFLPNLFFVSFETQLRSFRIVYSFSLNSRGLVCVQASPRRNANEPSLASQRRLAFSVESIQQFSMCQNELQWNRMRTRQLSKQKDRHPLRRGNVGPDNEIDVIM